MASAMIKKLALSTANCGPMGKSGVINCGKKAT